MDSDAGPAKLVNDAAREAVDAMRGYSYQVLRSIEAWLDLEDGQILILEGAEDLDRIDAAGALVEQVKDTVGSGNLTLRSANALAAIGNFWSHRERNPGTAIRFRYLTTSGIGQERGEDLLLPVPGIVAWEQIRRRPPNAASLSNARVMMEFLATRDELPLSLRNWLGTSSVDDFVTNIVAPFEWLTSQPGADGILRRIEAKLIELGEPRGIGAADAANALGSLHIEAWTNATDPNRQPLRRGDLLRIFEAAGSVTLPMSQLLDLMKQLTGASAPRTQVTRVEPTIAKPPMARTRRLSRPRLESAIDSALENGTVLIHGSTGTGKTVLAAAVGSADNTGWINLRDLGAPAIATRLDAAAATVERKRLPFVLVLDDLDVGDDPRALLPSLGRLVGALAAAKGSLLITASQRLPPRLTAVVGLTDERTFAAPLFETEEIAAYFAAEGCPCDKAETWSKIVYASTSGHPQLVDARLGALQQQGWPSPSIGEWLTPTSEVIDVRAEARRMVSALPEDQRELLARASLVLGRISRERLIAVGRIEPPLAEPGHTIDRLTGPWLEVTDTSDLRISPLLSGLGADTRGAMWNTAMHSGIAWAWIVDRKLAATDVSTLLMHAIISGRIGPLAHILPSLLEAPAEVWKQIGETAGIFSKIGVDGRQKSPFASAMDTGVFRILQLRIAAEVERDQIAAITSRALEESDAHPASDVGANFFDFMFLWQLVGVTDVERSVGAAIDLVLRFMRVAERVRNALARYGGEGRAVAETWPDLSPIASMTLLPSIVGLESFESFLNLVAELGPEERRFILPGQSDEIDMAGHTLDRLWLSEFENNSPDWAGFAVLLEKAVSLAADTGATTLAEAASALLVRVTDENLGDPPAALAAADRLSKMLDANHRVDAAKAKVLWRLGNLPEALEIYDRILPDLHAPPPYSVDIWRESALASARAGDWPGSANRFAMAVANPRPDEVVDRRAGFAFDHGLALHEAGNTRGAVEAFAAAIDALIEDGREPPPEPLVSVRQFGSQAIKSVLADLKGIPLGGVSDPAVLLGAASSLDTLNWGDQRPATTAIVAAMLVELELSLPGIPSVAPRLSEWIRRSGDALTLATSWANFNRLAVATSDMAPLMGDTIREQSYLFHVAAERDQGRDVFARVVRDPPIQPLCESSEIFFVSRILVSMVALLANGRIDELPLGRWNEDLPSHDSYDRLRELLSSVNSILFDANDPWPKVTAGHPSWSIHAITAIAALGRDRTPAELLICQSLAAHYLNQPQLAEFVAEPFSRLVTRAWEHLSDVPALLVTPRLSAPAIKQSIETTEHGWARTKAVLRAALNAVPRGTANQVRNLIASLPEA